MGTIELADARGYFAAGPFTDGSFEQEVVFVEVEVQHAAKTLDGTTNHRDTETQRFFGNHEFSVPLSLCGS
jgi:hypothetical protein